MAATGKESTGTRDTVYDLVSIIYHALQGAETYGMYITDAEQVEDTELAKFFQESRTRSDDAQTREATARRSAGEVTFSIRAQAKFPQQEAAICPIQRSKKWSPSPRL
jgi:hypothetical protein